MTPVIELSAVSKQIGERTLLHRIDFTLVSGETVALSGANGSGKTTVLKIMAGLSKPTDGTVRLFGQEPGAKARRRIGVLLDESFLYGDLTAQENLLYYARLYGLANPREVVQEWLHRVRLWHDARQLVKTFSKGMRQRLGIARAALHDPEVFLLDEPFDGLDVAHAASVEQWLREWQQQGRAVVLISHDERLTTRLATRQVRMEHGFLRSVHGLTEEVRQ